ncbi:MAG: molybdopterin-dependent oxidoreductase [Verrucomicrobia bacterium]|nr:molybdopterin-dependent oxidoreductase [Verrucomicrobiota bacterium]
MPTRITRRAMLRHGAALAALALARPPLALFGGADPAAGAALIPFLDAQPASHMLKWERLRSWITPNDQVFAVSHYGPAKVDLDRWQLELTGLVRRPRAWTLAELKARRRKHVTATLECSGNGSNPGFMGAIGNVTWTGTPLASLLAECGPLERAIEAVFFAADDKVEKIRERDYPQHFARSLALGDARREDVLLAYEMNGEPLPAAHGAPLRLVVPGWFGIAWVKWLTRIELLDRRFMNRFMARDYVTIRGEERDGQTIWRETSVGPIDVKSVVARAARLEDGTVRFSGAAWTDGTPLQTVELKIDDGSWTPVRLDRRNHARYAWTFWDFDWRRPAPGEHAVVSRAIDADGRVQPAPDDPAIRLKRTYWEANQQWPRKLRI